MVRSTRIPTALLRFTSAFATNLLQARCGPDVCCFRHGWLALISRCSASCCVDSESTRAFSGQGSAVRLHPPSTAITDKRRQEVDAVRF